MLSEPLKWTPSTYSKYHNAGAVVSSCPAFLSS